MPTAGRAEQGVGAPPFGARGGSALFAVLGLLALSTHAALAGTAPWPSSAGLFRALVLGAAAASALPALLASRLPAGRGAAAFVLAVSCAAHAMWLPVEPTLSDDVRRYVYEGRLVRQGLSPYGSPPAEAPGLEEAVSEVGHPELSSVYPPLSLLAFALGDLAGGVRGQKLVFGAASLAVAGLLAWQLVRAGRSPALACLYAWAPLPALEFAGQGHHDALGLTFLAASAGALAMRRPLASAFAWGFAAAAKGASIVTLPAFWPHWSVRARLAGLSLAGIGLVPVFLLSAGEHAGWHAYATRWSHNAPLHTLLTPWLGDGLAVRGLLAALLVVSLWAVARARLSLAAAAGAATALALALSPTVHPWYAAWALLWAPLVPSLGLWALGQTVLLTYALPGGPETPGYAAVPLAWQLVEWGVPLGLGALELWRRPLARFDGGGGA